MILWELGIHIYKFCNIVLPNHLTLVFALKCTHFVWHKVIKCVRMWTEDLYEDIELHGSSGGVVAGAVN